MTEMRAILLVEDDPAQRALVGDILHLSRAQGQPVGDLLRVLFGPGDEIAKPLEGNLHGPQPTRAGFRLREPV